MAQVSKESDRRNHTDSSRRGRGSYPGQPIRYLGQLIRYPGKVVPDRGPETKKSIEFVPNQANSIDFLKKKDEKETGGNLRKNLGEKNFLGLISKHPSAATI